jgi:hypothetical protein
MWAHLTGDTRIGTVPIKGTQQPSYPCFGFVAEVGARGPQYVVTTAAHACGHPGGDGPQKAQSCGEAAAQYRSLNLCMSLG